MQAKYRHPLLHCSNRNCITFRAGLFNIGVEGTTSIGRLFGAYLGAMFVLPPVLHILVIMIIAMTIGGLWAAIAGYLKVKRGVSDYFHHHVK